MSKQETGVGEWRDGEHGPRRDIGDGVQLARAGYLNALEAELTRLREYKALAGEIAPLVQKTLMFGQTIYQADFQREWLARYDALQEQA